MHMTEPLTYETPHERRPTPLAELLMLAVPTVAQMASYSVMHFTDTYLLSKLGTHEPTAASQAGMFTFALISFGIGALWLVNALASQNFGRKNYTQCGVYMWQGIWFGVLIAICLLPSRHFAYDFFHALGHEPHVVQLETDFFQVSMLMAVLKLINTAIEQFMLAIDRPRVVLLATFTGVVINIPANIILIYGHFGMPALGVKGSAWGTNIAFLVELIVLCFFAFGPKIRQKYGTLNWKPKLAELKLLLRTGLPTGVQMTTDILAWSFFSTLVIGHFGTQAMAANTFLFRYITLSFMPAFGISAAVTALVGRYIGMKLPHEAARRAHIGAVVSTSYMFICGIFFLIFRHDLMRVFTSDPVVLVWGGQFFICAAVFQLFDAMYITYSSALRGAGDTFVPALATGLTCWGMIVGVGWLVGYLYPQWGPVGPWAIATLYVFMIGLFMLIRFQRGGWKQIRLDETPSADKVSATEPVQVVTNEAPSPTTPGAH